jgi:hypothetical protein
LTIIISRKVKFEWYSSHQQVFDKIKKVIGTEVLFCYPDFNKPVLFHLNTDESDYLLGSVIIQDKKPIAFYSSKLNTTQKWYTTTERESERETCYQLLKPARNTRISY